MSEMEGDLPKSAHVGYSVDSTDAKYVSGLSTILVATIQEAKDRISQIEYIFCSQLFPNFQSKSKGLQKIYSDARKAAEDAWLEKEKKLLLRIEELQFEKQQAIKENESLRSEKAKFVNIEYPSLNCVDEIQEELKHKTQEVGEGRESQQNLIKLLESKASQIINNEKKMKELEVKNNLLLKKHRSLELEADELRLELKKKSEEVDGGMELQNKLLQLVQSKASLILHKEKQLKEHEEKIDELLEKLESRGKKFDKLQWELREKTGEVDKGKELQENLLKKIESQASMILTNEQLLHDYEKQKKLLTTKLGNLEENVDGIQKELRKKIEEVEEGIKLQEELLQQIHLKSSEIVKARQESEELEEEKRLLLAKLKCLEEKVDKLQVDLRRRSNESAEGMELHGKLLQQIEAKDSELVFQKKKRMDAVDAYKRLKSQYNFLCRRYCLTTENVLTQNIGEECDSLRHNQDPLTSPDVENTVPKAASVVCEMNELKDNQEHLEDERVKSSKRSNSGSPSSLTSPIAPKYPTNVKSGPLAGMKRPVSSWRGTRSHQNRDGPDPHDDFLDTPLENVRGNLKKAMKEEVHDLPGLDPKDMNFGSPDDEVKDLNVDPSPQKKQMPPPRPGARGFKYVEPVRKKSERENLKGFECKQCKKFYDAVLPDGGDNDIEDNKQKLRCEHHDGVSRHRYRYAPPLTPEGFWNIGFESEM